VPSFGKSSDEYDPVGLSFYSYWSGYVTPRSYSWLDKYDTRYEIPVITVFFNLKCFGSVIFKAMRILVYVILIV
jgi:hypothetical protein